MLRFFLLLIGLGFLVPAQAQQLFNVNVEVRDKYTQRPIPAIVSVRALDSEEEIKGSMTGDQYVVKVKPKTTYQVVVALQEYNTYRQEHIFDSKNGPLIVVLNPINPPKNTSVATAAAGNQNLLVVDKKTKAVVKSAVVTIKTANGQYIAVNKNGQTGAWTAALDDYETYIVEVKAKDYETYKDMLKAKRGETTEIGISPVARLDLIFQAVDAKTNKPVAARFKLTDNIRETYSGATNADVGYFEATVLIQNDWYYLTVVADGYKLYQEKISSNAALAPVQSNRLVKLSKADAFLQIKVVEDKTNTPITNAHVRVVDKAANRSVLDVKEAAGGEAVAQVSSEGQYELEVEAPGYAPYKQSVKQPVQNEVVLPIKLTKLLDSYISLSATDAAKGELVAATFKITSVKNNQPLEVKTSPVAKTGKLKVTEPAVYRIETNAVGFRTHRGELNAEEMNLGKVFKYEALLMPEEKKAIATTTPPATVVPPTAAKPSEPAKPVTKPFIFRAVDAQSKRTLQPKRFTVKNQKTQQTLSPIIKAGVYEINLSLDTDYFVEVEADGFAKADVLIEGEVWAKRADFRRNILLTPAPKSATPATPIPSPAKTGKAPNPINLAVFDNLKGGQSVVIEDNVYFDQSSYILRPEAYGQLNRLVAAMLKNPKLRIEIIGHTDNVGDPRLNLILSENRAKVIANFLNGKGITDNRILHRGYGQTKPLTTNDNEDNKRRNRRVEFIVSEYN